MRKSEIFAEILHAVSQETEVPPKQILSRKKDEETVDARYLLIHFLEKNGFCPSRIAACINKDVRTVNMVITRFDERETHRKYFGILLENLRKTLGNKGFLP